MNQDEDQIASARGERGPCWLAASGHSGILHYIDASNPKNVRTESITLDLSCYITHIARKNATIFLGTMGSGGGDPGGVYVYDFATNTARLLVSVGSIGSPVTGLFAGDDYVLVCTGIYVSVLDLEGTIINQVATPGGATRWAFYDEGVISSMVGHRELWVMNIASGRSAVLKVPYDYLIAGVLSDGIVLGSARRAVVCTVVEIDDSFVLEEHEYCHSGVIDADFVFSLGDELMAARSIEFPPRALWIAADRHFVTKGFVAFDAVVIECK